MQRLSAAPAAMLSRTPSRGFAVNLSALKIRIRATKNVSVGFPERGRHRHYSTCLSPLYAPPPLSPPPRLRTLFFTIMLTPIISFPTLLYPSPSPGGENYKRHEACFLFQT